MSHPLIPLPFRDEWPAPLKGEVEALNRDIAAWLEDREAATRRLNELLSVKEPTKERADAFRKQAEVLQAEAALRQRAIPLLHAMRRLRENRLHEARAKLAAFEAEIAAAVNREVSTPAVRAICAARIEWYHLRDAASAHEWDSEGELIAEHHRGAEMAQAESTRYVALAHDEERRIAQLAEAEKRRREAATADEDPRAAKRAELEASIARLLEPEPGSRRRQRGAAV